MPFFATLIYVSSTPSVAAESSIPYAESVRCAAATGMNSLNEDIKNFLAKDNKVLNADVKSSDQWRQLAIQNGQKIQLRENQVDIDIQNAQAEFSVHNKQLDDDYTNSNPSLRLMPYYKRLTVAERSNLRQRMDVELADNQARAKRVTDDCNAKLALAGK